MYHQLWQSIEWLWPHGVCFYNSIGTLSQGNLYESGVPRHNYDRNVRSPESTIRLSSFGSVGLSCHYGYGFLNSYIHRHRVSL